MADDESFLSRWARRKGEAKRPAPVQDSAPGRAETVARPAETRPVTSESADGPQTRDPHGAAPLTEEEVAALPDPDTLTDPADFKVFLRQGVPHWLKTKAMRKMWTTNPVFANVDGLVDYGEDFTDAARAVTTLATAYKVGSGYRRDPEPEPDTAQAETTHTEPAHTETAPTGTEQTETEQTETADAGTGDAGSDGADRPEDGSGDRSGGGAPTDRGGSGPEQHQDRGTA